MDRRLLITSSLAYLGASAVARAQELQPPARNEPPAQDVPPPPPVAKAQEVPSEAPPAQAAPPPAPPPERDDAGAMPPPRQGLTPNYKAETYSKDEIVNQVSDFFGVAAEAAASVVERIFRDNGRPTGYIAGEEGSGAFFVGLRYGKGRLYMKHQPEAEVFWQGPSIGWDWGGNGSRVFTLCYNLQYPDMIYRRFPGVDGSAYLIGGLGVNYQRAEDITLAPIRAGVGLRLGANIGYLAYTRKQHLLPL
ncbi:DUF1134 domain-containing protein [Phenylobacterium montanum]|uniref:DUF1134 domain-containing protein n=1 Tax=Phenylobacterium montanum TaxID=2823693 RepID=A0A975FY72_9CAUL|nr:DUF1134 domain-containing protein [Caulobacter sp. S6]QUD87475.1 DUF1134 domain-containing protein [Caulobacter sp. S6]